jgi:type IV pilus assembly protein PilM
MPLKKSGGPIVGLDIGSSFIKACEVDIRGGQANLRGIAVLPTPPDLVVNNEISDPVALGKLIKQVLAQSGIKAKAVVTSVAGTSSLVVRIIEVPKMTQKELQETMKWEIERHVPFAAEQVVMDYQPLSPPEEVPDGQNMEVLLAVAQEALVTMQVKTMQAAGLKPVAIDIEPLASSRALLDLPNGAGPVGTIAIVDVGAQSTDISIYRDGRIAFTRSIQLAGNTLTKAISDVLGQPLAEAERLKKELAAIPEAPAQPQGMGLDPFGSDMPALDFGMPEDAGGLPLGGSFGVAPTPGASTATDTHSEPEYDVAGGGFSTDMFTTPAEGGAPADPAASPFGAPAPGAESASPFAALAGPTPGANPFDPGAGEATATAPEATATSTHPDGSPFGGPSPFESGGSLFGGAPGADPFAPVDDLGALGGFGSPAPAAPTGAPAAMTEEEYLRTQISDAIMPVLHEMVTELRRSLDFYRNRAAGMGAQQVVVCGGTAKLPGLSEFLTINLETPVIVGNPLQYLSIGAKADAAYLQDVGPFFSVSVGLAARELMSDPPPPKAAKAPKAPKAPKPPKAKKGQQ